MCLCRLAFSAHSPSWNGKQRLCIDNSVDLRIINAYTTRPLGLSAQLDLLREHFRSRLDVQGLLNCSVANV